MEYITSWIKAEFVPSKAWPYTLLMLTKIQNRFGSPRELINDNALKFSGNTAKSWHKKHGTRILFTILAKSYDNGKIKQINGKLKGVIIRVSFIYKDIPSPDLLQIAINIHNRTPKPNDYSPYFLFHGTTPPEHTSPKKYTRKSTSEKREHTSVKEHNIMKHPLLGQRQTVSKLKPYYDEL
jgi:transposase InsO family protein